jgi:uncharacterized membrane protein YbhN (UPF0104 family)
MFAALRGANPGELVLAGCCFAAGVACSAASWRTLIGRTVSLGDACARYGTGSLVNTFVPARAGDAVRLGLFGRVAPGGLLAATGVAAAVGTARWLTVVPLAIGGTAAARLQVPPIALAAAGAAALPLAAAWLLACRGSRRAAALLAPLRGAGTRCLATLFAWVAGTIGARIAAATLAAAALGVPRPLTAALLVVPALELAGIVPLTPANVGVAGGAAALAFHAHGVPLHAALAAGLALHAVETVTGFAFGALGAAAVLRSRRAAVTESSPPVSGADPHERVPGAEDRRDSVQLRARGNDEETHPQAAPTGSDRCRCHSSRARSDDTGRGQGPRRRTRIRNGDADSAPGRDLPGERLVRPLLRHVPERGQHRRAEVRRRAAHARRRRPDAGHEPVAAFEPAA